MGGFARVTSTFHTLHIMWVYDLKESGLALYLPPLIKGAPRGVSENGPQSSSEETSLGGGGIECARAGSLGNERSECGNPGSGEHRQVRSAAIRTDRFKVSAVTRRGSAGSPDCAGDKLERLIGPGGHSRARMCKSENTHQ